MEILPMLHGPANDKIPLLHTKLASPPPIEANSLNEPKLLGPLFRLLDKQLILE
jgi:hypothetical protein